MSEELTHEERHELIGEMFQRVRDLVALLDERVKKLEEKDMGLWSEEKMTKWERGDCS